MTYLREWHIRGTRIQQLPDYIMDFQDLTVLEIPKNGLRKLPVEIGTCPPPSRHSGPRTVVCGRMLLILSSSSTLNKVICYSFE